jgi:hypothetical protein
VGRLPGAVGLAEHPRILILVCFNRRQETVLEAIAIDVLAIAKNVIFIRHRL